VASTCGSVSNWLPPVARCTRTTIAAAEIAGFICESFAYQVPAPALVLALVRLLGRIAPRLPVLKLHSLRFSRRIHCARAKCNRRAPWRHCSRPQIA